MILFYIFLNKFIDIFLYPEKFFNNDAD